MVLTVFLAGGGIGYHNLRAKLQAEISTPASTRGGVTTTPTTFSSPLGDLSVFSIITQDTLAKLNTGDQSGATARISDLEYAWDQARGKLQTKNNIEWTKIDGKIDTVLRELRAINPNSITEKSALEALLVTLK